MKRHASVVAIVILSFLILGAVRAAENPVLWKGSVCTDVTYQKSIEAVAITNGTVYAACSYRQVVNSGKVVAVYYLGKLAAFNLNGTRLWNESSGYAVKVVPVGRDVLVGSLAGVLLFSDNGSMVAQADTTNKLYDFVVLGSRIYAVDGDFYPENGSYAFVGHVYAGTFNSSNVSFDIWELNVSDMLTRIRIGKDVIYASSGFPSGYAGPVQFGALYGISPEGKLLWKLKVGHWIRDLEVWGGNAIFGTGFGEGSGNLYVVSPKGHVLLNESAFYVEDIVVEGNTAYVSGYNGKNGTVEAVELPSGKVKWKILLPYRAKVLCYADGLLLVGVGKFEKKSENGATYVYSVGSLYALNPSTGKVIGQVPNTGYVRSISAFGDRAVFGTASSTFYVIDLNAFKNSENRKICGPGLVILLAVLLTLTLIRIR